MAYLGGVRESCFLTLQLVILTTNTSSPTQTKRDERIFLMSRMGVGWSPRGTGLPWAESDWKVDWSKTTSVPLAKPTHRSRFPSILERWGDGEGDGRVSGRVGVMEVSECVR